MRRDPRVMSEAVIQESVVRLLETYGAPGVCWFAVPNGEWRRRRVAMRLKAQGTRAGAPDLVLCVEGRFHGLELKTVRGRLSPVQRRMAVEIAYAGGSYHLCHGLTEAVKLLIDLGCLRPGIRFLVDGKPVDVT